MLRRMGDALKPDDGPRLTSERLTARLAPNRGTNGGFSLIIDGTTQSHVNPADPTDLQLVYVQLIAVALDALRTGPLDALHLGGGALSMPRYLAATRPGSKQHVVELYQELYEFVVEHLPIPDDILTVEFTDAREATEQLATDGAEYDLVIVDVYSGDIAPRHISTTEFFRTADRLLRPDGLLIANTLATHGLAFTREAAATLREVFAEVVAVGSPAVLRGDRVGNVELIASQSPIDLRALTRAAESRNFTVVAGPELDALVAGALPRHD